MIRISWANRNWTAECVEARLVRLRVRAGLLMELRHREPLMKRQWVQCQHGGWMLQLTADVFAVALFWEGRKP